jgi:20S proteasome alpha/beta subunit
LHYIYAAEKIHRIDHHCLLLTTGLGGDCLTLAQSARVAAQRFQLMHGEVPTVAEIARDAVAQVQHELTKMSGARPFGVTATVFGVDRIPTSSGNNTLWTGRLFQSESGGTLQEYDFCSSGRGRKGALASLDQLHTRLLHYPAKDKAQNVTTASESRDERLEMAIKGVATAVLKGDADAKQVDIWIVEPSNGNYGRQRRRNCRIRYAEAVQEADLPKATNRLMN